MSDGSPYGFTIAPATSDVHTMLNWTPAVPTGASDTYEIVADVTAVAEEVNTGNNVAVIFVLVVK